MNNFLDFYKYFICGVLFLWVLEVSLVGRLEIWIWINIGVDGKFLELGCFCFFFFYGCMDSFLVIIGWVREDGIEDLIVVYRLNEIFYV